jgi:hypothetical protein
MKTDNAERARPARRHPTLIGPDYRSNDLEVNYESDKNISVTDLGPAPTVPTTENSGRHSLS